MNGLRGSHDFNENLYSISCQPHAHSCYSRCDVNDVKYIIEERDILKTQNSGVMVQTDDDDYYGILEDVIELKYPGGVSVIVFKCRWYKSKGRNRKVDHGLLSLDTSTFWYEDSPFCLASTVRQVFYVDDPNMGDTWKVVNIVSHRGTYNASSLARDENVISNQVVSAYQEDTPMNIPQVPIDSLQVDLGSLPQVDHVQDYINEDDDEEQDDEGFNVPSEEEDDGVNIDDEDVGEYDLDHAGAEF